MFGHVRRNARARRSDAADRAKMQLSWPLSVAIIAFIAAATVANHDRVGRAVTRARLRDFYAREGEE